MLNGRIAVFLGIILTIPCSISAANSARCDVTHCNSAPSSEQTYDFQIIVNNPTCPCGQMSIMCSGIPKDDILYLIDQLQENCLALQLAFQTINDYEIPIGDPNTDPDPENDPMLKYVTEFNSYPWQINTWTDEIKFEHYKYTLIQIPVFRTFILRHDQLVKKGLGNTMNLLFVLAYYSPLTEIPAENFDHPTMTGAVYAKQLADYERTGLIRYTPDRTYFEIDPVIHDALIWLLEHVMVTESREHKLKAAKFFIQGYMEEQIQKNGRQIEGVVLKHAKNILKHMQKMVAGSLDRLHETHAFGMYIGQKLSYTKQYKELLDVWRILLENNEGGTGTDDSKYLSTINMLENKLDALTEMMRRRPMVVASRPFM